MSSGSDDEILAIAGALYWMQKRRKKKRCWVKPWLSRRTQLGAYRCLMAELRNEDVDEYQHFLRMEPQQFDFLFNAVKKYIEKQDTILRSSIPPGERLAVTLRFLATGDSYRSLSYLYRISRQALGHIIPETCQAIYQVLHSEYLKVPNTTEEWDTISKDFSQKWQFPNCLGALDGKHTALKVPGYSGSNFFNYKGHHSIVLLAVVDAHYRFIMFDVGVNGSNSDAGVYAASSISTALDENHLHIPPPKALPDWHALVPHVIVGDEAFPLKPYLMKPFPAKGLSDEDRIFNYRLSHARRVSENAFGILVNRFSVLANKMNLNPGVATTVTKACIALHNFLRTEHDVRYAQDVPRREACLWQAEMGPQAGYHSTESARNIRLQFRDFFCTTGSVDWQWDHCSLKNQ